MTRRFAHNDAMARDDSNASGEPISHEESAAASFEAGVPLEANAPSEGPLRRNGSSGAGGPSAQR